MDSSRIFTAANRYELVAAPRFYLNAPGLRVGFRVARNSDRGDERVGKRSSDVETRESLDAPIPGVSGAFRISSLRPCVCVIDAPSALRSVPGSVQLGFRTAPGRLPDPVLDPGGLSVVRAE